MGKGLEKLERTKDLISNLPDGIIVYILSFLSTKDVVRTCVLSRRWKHFWAFVPALDLSYMDFFSKRCGLDIVERRRAEFLVYVYEFLLRNNSSGIKKFRLRSYECYDQVLIKSWICAARKNKVQELQLDLNQQRFTLHFRKVVPLLTETNDSPYIGRLCLHTSSESDLDFWVCVVTKWNITKLELDFTFRGEMQKFPRCFPFETLVVLKLHCVFLNFPIAPMGCFPKLKVLHLVETKFESGSSVSNMISSCPMLEELHMMGPSGDSVHIPNITSHGLRVLTLWIHDPLEVFDTTEVDAPNLEYLDIHVDLMKYVFTDLNLLVEAKLRFADTLYKHESSRQLFRKICKIKYLEISTEAMLSLFKIQSSIPTFHNLIRLEIATKGPKNRLHWDEFIGFLWKLPKLKHFVTNDYFYPHVQVDDWIWKDVPSCLESELETINFFCYVYDNLYPEFMRLFLQNSKVLKKMRMMVRRCYPTEVIKEALLAYPRASTTCQIEVASRAFIDIESGFRT